MRIVPLIEVELDCLAGSPVDYRVACDLPMSAVCTGALVELMLVACRELSTVPVQLRDLVLSGHAPIGDGMRLLGRAYDGSLEVIGGSLAGREHWQQTHACASLASEPSSLYVTPHDPSVLTIGDACLLEQVCTRAGGLQGSFVLEARRDEARRRVRLTIDPEQLADVGSYALHPLLWEAGVVVAEHLLAGYGAGSRPVRALRVSSMSMERPSGFVRAIEVERVEQGVSVRWMGDGGALVAEARGLTLGPFAAEAAGRRCARIVQATLGKRVERLDQPLAELGVSSIDRARVAAALALDFGSKPKLEAILACESLADIAAVFANAAQDDAAIDGLESHADAGARYVLSPAQQQVWALQAMAPDTPRCHVHMRLRCEGRLDDVALRIALQRLIARHAALRVVIDTSGDQPLQRVLSAPVLALDLHDLSALSTDERGRELLRVSDRHARARFDLERGPLVRFARVALGPQDHAILISAHHVIIDGFGLELLVRELLALYETPDAFAGEMFDLDRIAQRYTPDAQRRAAASGVFPARDAARRVPLARDPTGAQAGRGARVELAGLAALEPALRALSQREHVSLFSLLCAAYGAVLARHAGQDEVVIGVVSAGRATFAQLEAVGMFARSVPLRLAIDSERSLVAIAREIHARVPQLIGEESPAPDASPFAATALFQQWSNAPLRAGGLIARLELDSPDGAPTGYCRSELELLAADYGATLTACLQYDISSLSELTVRWLANATSMLLARSCEAPERALSDTSLAGASGIVLEGASRAVEPELVHTMIALRAAASPAAAAVRDASGAQLSFAELLERSYAVARALRARGAVPGRYVAILAERTADLPVAVLAVLSSGAAYVPIDPTHPAERVESALSDTSADLVIALTATDRRFEAAEVVTLGELLQASVNGPIAWEPPRGGDAAYVLHTSGSTGKPKGVVVEHRSLASFVLAMTDLLPSDAQKPWLALTTLAFDISIVELLFSLAVGAEVRVGKSPSLRSGDADPFGVLRTLGADVKCFQCTPSLARLLLEDAAGRAFLGGLAVLLVGGESLPVWLARALCDVVPGAVLNMYGPTETTVWSSAAWLRSDAAWVPIGQPLVNTTLRVMDETGCDVAPGLSGELWIGGAGVARGYLARPDETAVRFVDRGGERFYRTGDLVRMRLLEGAAAQPYALEWLGRMDRQIKLAGNRIELGEIEGVLSQHPFARECAAITVRTGSEERLVAFVVPDAANMADATTGEAAMTGIFSHEQIEAVLLAWAEQKLPAYMLPARIFTVDALPRTASGKTDRGALVDLASYIESSAPPSLSERPVTREEKLLAELWGEVLARTDVGRYDDFFALGGTSFAAVLLASRARKHGIALAPSTVLAYPTLAEQALQISAVVVQREARALQEDVQLEELPDAVGAAAWPPKQIVLTGATGFLGAQLLVELQASLDTTVVCLIRARDDHAARERLEQALGGWGLASRVQWSLTRCVAADLTLPRFGLSDDEWQLLAEQSDLVLHNAADVNFALGYDELRAANVGGTRTAIALAAEGKRKPLHYVSTIAITDAHDPGVDVDEDTPLPRSEQLLDGYSQSKWVAEGLVLLAGDRGLNVTCYRAGPLVLDRAPKGDAFAEALATVARSGISFATPGRVVPHLSRVDDTARAIVLLALDRRRRSRIEHVVSPQHLPVAELLAWIREWGFDVTELSDDEWLKRIDAEPWAAATMFVVSQRLRDGIPLVPEVEHAATIVRLCALGFAWQEIDGVLIQRLLARLTGNARAAEAS